MQSNEDEARTPEAIIHEAETAIWKDSEYFTAEDVFVLAKAVQAERDRADRAVTCVEQISAAVYGRKIPYTAEGGHAVINDVLSALSRFREATA